MILKRDSLCVVWHPPGSFLNKGNCWLKVTLVANTMTALCKLWCVRLLMRGNQLFEKNLVDVLALERILDDQVPEVKEMCQIRLLTLIGHLYLSGMWFGVAPKNRHVFKRDWIAWPKYDNHYRPNRTYMTIQLAWEYSLWVWIKNSCEFRKLWGKWLRPLNLDLLNHLGISACSYPRSGLLEKVTNLDQSTLVQFISVAIR